jgi:hypothetical protein
VTRERGSIEGEEVGRRIKEKDGKEKRRKRIAREMFHHFNDIGILNPFTYQHKGLVGYQKGSSQLSFEY